MELYIRVVQKSGSKMTIEGEYDLSKNFKENLGNVFNAVGFKAANFKVFHNDTLLDANTEFSKIFEVGKDTYLFAFESMGKPKKWTRFPRCYEYGTWSCGGSADAIKFIPSKSITLAGFQVYVPKEDPDFEYSYEIKIDGNVVEEGPNTKVTEYEDTYFKTVMLKSTHSVNANSQINILVRIARTLSSNSYTNTYYGTDGYDYRTVQNEHMDLFTLSYGDGCCNGTSESSGQIPSILYYLE